MQSTLTKNQKKKLGPRTDQKLVEDYGQGAMLTITVRHDDECNNGHNTFAITAQVMTTESKKRNDIQAGGTMPEEVSRLFPELAPLIKWHGTSTDGPLHYIPNTLYWLGWSGWCDGKPTSPPCLDYARKSAVWPELPESYVAPVEVRTQDHRKPVGNTDEIEKALSERLDGLLKDFRAAVESLGFTY